MKLFKTLAIAALASAIALPAAAQLNPTPGASSLPQVAEVTALRGLYNDVNPRTKWSYVAASGGITDTTAVTIKAAAGAGKKNYIRACQISNSGAAGTEVILRSGAAGTVIWRHWVAQTSDRNSIIFHVPLESAANTLLEVVLSSGTTVAVRVNCQGYTD